MTQDIPFHINQIVTDIRRTIHQSPELSNHELETSAFVRNQLADHGVDSVTMLDTASFSVDIEGENNQSRRRIAVRADLDALPISEETGHSYSSNNDGIMHACGHDGHTAMVAGLGIWLHRRRSELPGSVRLIFQQAEETEPLGSRNVLSSGAIDHVDGVIGLHVDPGIPTGQITVREGAYAASGDEFTITVIGKSSHAAKPHEGVDAIAISASLIQEVQKIRSRLTDPQSPFVITIAKINGGVVTNILCDKVVIEGTIRALEEGARSTAHSLLKKLSRDLASMYGGEAHVEIFEGEPVLMNDARMTELVRNAGRKVLGESNVLDLPPWAASDDFAFYSQIKPSVYFRLGVRNEAKNCVYGLHHPKFDLDEDALSVGIRVLNQAVSDFLESDPDR